MPDVKEVVGKILDKQSKEVIQQCTALINYGETVEESTEMFGGDAVNSNAWANWKITARAAVVRMMIAGKSDEEIQSTMENAKMGIAVSGGAVDPIQASLAKFKLMNGDEQADYLEKLREAAAAG